MSNFDVTEFTPEQLEMLQAPLDASQIKQRPGGGGRMFKYISGDTAMDTANRIFGYGKWGYDVVARDHKVIEDEKKGRMDFYTADVKLYVAGAAFPFPGGGVGIVNAPYTVDMHEKAYKEAETDALKRALRHYGDQFGLCLYNEDDYVDAGDGTMIQVKEVKPNGRAPQAKRVVDAAHTPKQLPQATQPTSSVNAPAPKFLRKKCEALFPGKWDEVKVRLLGENIPDDNLTPEDCGKIQRSFEIVEQRRREGATEQQAS